MINKFANILKYLLLNLHRQKLSNYLAHDKTCIKNVNVNDYNNSNNVKIFRCLILKQN